MSKAREKAREIFNKFQDTIWNSECTISKPMLKAVSILHVNEIISEYQKISDLKSIIIINDEEFTVVGLIIYWREVEIELNKL